MRLRTLNGLKGGTGLSHAAMRWVEGLGRIARIPSLPDPSLPLPCLVLTSPGRRLNSGLRGWSIRPLSLGTLGRLRVACAVDT